MSLTEENHTTLAHRQLDDELQCSLLHNASNSLHGEAGNSCLVFRVIQPPFGYFFVFFFVLKRDTWPVLKDNFGLSGFENGLS